MKKFLSLLACICAVFFITACNNGEPSSPLTVSVALDLNGGQIDGNTSYTATIGENLNIVTPIKHGYTFVGWSYKGEIIDLTPFSISEYAIILKAEWSEKPCTISLDAYGGTLSGEPSIVVRPGDVIEISNPTRVGYSFDGWTYNGGLVNLQTFSVEKLYDVTFRAKWSPKSYSVLVDFDGGYVEENSVKVYEKAISVDYNGSLSLPVPTKTGYVFSGYTYSGNTVGSVWSFDVDDAVIKAVWSPLTINYTINASGATVDFSGNALPEGGVITYGESTDFIKSVIPVKKGYNFNGWYVLGQPILDNFNYFTSLYKVEIVANFSAKSFELSLNAGEGSLSGEGNYLVSYGEEVNFEVPTPPENKEFLGWKTSGGDLISTPLGYCLFYYEYEGELTAEYSDVQYLMFIHHDGEIEKLEIPLDNELTIDDLPTPKTKRGYYVEWEYQEDEIISSIETLVIKAVCTPMKTRVRFDGDYNDLIKTYDFDSLYEMPTESVDGHEFLGWSLSKKDKENVIKGEYLWNFTQLDITLYAIHIPKTYKITYDTSNVAVEHYLTNNGERVNNEQYVTYGQEYALYVPVVKDDLLSIKWYLDQKEISSVGVWNTAKDVTLKAKFTLNPVEVSLTIDVNGGEGRKDAVITLNNKLETISNKPTAPSGYELIGYSYKGKIYLLSEVWNVLDYDGTPLIAQYKEEPLIIKLKLNLNGGSGSTIVKITVGQKLKTISSKPSAPEGYYLVGFTYQGEFYSLDSVWNVADYNYTTDEPLIAVYEDDSHLWS